MQRIFVGDVQGCADELESLVARAKSEFGSEFELWLVGDLVNRGPDNLRVLRLARELRDAGRARVVLGNHEVGLLLKSLGLRGASASDTIEDVLCADDARDWLAWLRELPLCETGAIAGQPFAMVHAAVDPDWTLDSLAARARAAGERLRAGSLDDLARFLATDPAADADRAVLDQVTRCRSVREDGAWSDALPAAPGDAWHARWRARDHDYGVVYGHWALQGLHLERGLRGLDTGCVHHGRDHDGALTAWLPDEHASAARAAFDVPEDPARLWQVPARRRYVGATSRRA